MIHPVTDLRDMLLSRSKSVPDKIAFRYRIGNKKIRDLSFSAFAQEVEILGNFLLNQGFSGKHIAISGANTYEWLLALFAVITSGNVAVAIDNELGPEELEKLLLQSDSEAVFCSQEKYDALIAVSNDNNFNAVHFPFESLSDKVAEPQETGQKSYSDVVIDPKSLALIFFTSGTSGESKAVPLSHFAIISTVNYNREKYKAPEKTLSVLPFHHAFGLVVGIFMVFNEEKSIFINTQLRDLLSNFQAASPMAVAVVPLYLEFIYKRIKDTIKEKKLTLLFKLLIKISRFLRAIGIYLRRKMFASVYKPFGGSIAEFISGGAALNPDLIKFYDDIGIIVINGYGLTECSPVISTEKIDERKLGSCGKPLSCCSVRIAEDGEIIVKGDNIFSGYYKDEKQTQEVLSNGEFATGDLGHLDEEGFLFITGRKKNTIVLSNGENISPEEIEVQLLKEEGIQEVVVVEKNNQVVALVYPTEEYKTDTNHFQLVRNRYNKRVPITRKIADIILRETEFEKNSSRKILRDRIKL